MMILSTLAAMLPNVFLAILAKLVTQSFLQSVLEKTIIYSLNHAVKLTTNSVDDEIAAEVEARLRAAP